MPSIADQFMSEFEGCRVKSKLGKRTADLAESKVDDAGCVTYLGGTDEQSVDEQLEGLAGDPNSTDWKTGRRIHSGRVVRPAGADPNTEYEGEA